MTMKIQSIPKAELHCHIEGAAHPEFIRKQAEKYNVDLSAIFSDDGETYNWDNFTSFLQTYAAVSKVLQCPEDYVALTKDVLLRQAAQNVIYQEFFCSHDNSDRMGCHYKDMVEAMAEGARLAKQETGIEVRFCITGVRNIGIDHVEQAAVLAEKFPHPMVTGFGMAGDERMGEVKHMAGAFERARKGGGLQLTAHAGELCGAHSVANCLDDLKVARIGHGVRSIEDKNLIKRLVEQQIVLEVCPGSNLALGIFNKNNHPLAQLKNAGVQVTLSSDDPPFFQTSTNNEYRLARTIFGFTDEELLETTRVSLQAAFVDESTRKKLLTRLNTNIADQFAKKSYENGHDENSGGLN